MSKPVYHIEASNKTTHTRKITLEDLIELFKDHCGAPESAQVLFNYHLGELKRKIEIVWIEDASKRILDIPTETTICCVPGIQIQERSETPCPPPTITLPVATYNVQVGDLVMFQPFGDCAWYGPAVLEQSDADDKKFGVVKWHGRCRVRHLTDEERAKIKRI